jgi:hypothetical protein
MFTASINFNRRAERWAETHDKPLVGDCDGLKQLGSTYSLVEAEPDPEAICAAIRAGRVEVNSRPLAWGEAASIMSSLVAGDILSLKLPS